MSRKLAILDRDGVINRERGEHTWSTEDFEFLPSSLEAVKRLHNEGWFLAVVTNQSGIGLKLYDHDDVQSLFSLIKEEWRKLGVKDFHALYCPHHPSNGTCLCRKPGSLLLERALHHFGVSSADAFFVGDRQRDVDAATAAGMEGLLISANGDLLEFLIAQGKITA